MNKEEKLKREKRAKEINGLKGFRITLVICLIILLSLISFAGIYVKDKNKMSNLLPDFVLGSDIQGNRVIEFKVEKDQTITLKDSNGNVIATGTESELNNQGYTQEVITQNNYTKTSEETNKQEDLTQANYEKSKEILVNRLKSSGVTDYKVRADKNNGNIVVEMKEDTKTDNVVSSLAEVGKFELRDSETKEVLLNNDDIKDAKVSYNNTQSGVNVYLEIVFNKNGKDKLKEISKTYNSNAVAENTTTNTTADQEITANELEQNSTTEATDENNTTNETSGDSTNTKASTKKVDMLIDGTTITQGQQFSEENITGILDLLIGTGSAINSSDQNNKLTKYVNQAQSMVAVLKNGAMPIKYSTETNKYIESAITTETGRNAIIAAIIIIAIMFIILIIRFKINGILATVSNIGYVALIFILLRLTKVEIGVGGIIGLLLMQLLNYIQLNMILKAIKGKKSNDKIINKVMVKICYILVPTYIISIVFAFNSYVPIYSFGMVVFWGITLSIVYNLLITKSLFLKAEEK